MYISGKTYELLYYFKIFVNGRILIKNNKLYVKKNGRILIKNNKFCEIKI